MKRLKDARNIPTTVNVGYQHFEIRVCGEVGGLSNRNRGAVSYHDHIISLDGSVILEDGAETLLHELLHIAWESGHLDAAVGHDTEEKVVGTLSKIMATIMHDNPDLFKWIIKSVG